MSIIKYETEFNLTNHVNDFVEASKFLHEDDTTKYLDEGAEYAGKIADIRWDLETVDSGKIRVFATKRLSEKALKQLSDWIKGQCSDGLGESFEQQDFAVEYDEDDEDDEDDEYMYNPEGYSYMSSFDYRSNDYKLVEVKQ